MIVFDMACVEMSFGSSRYENLVAGRAAAIEELQAEQES